MRYFISKLFFFAVINFLHQFKYFSFGKEWFSVVKYFTSDILGPVFYFINYFSQIISQNTDWNQLNTAQAKHDQEYRGNAFGILRRIDKIIDKVKQAKSRRDQKNNKSNGLNELKRLFTERKDTFFCPPEIFRKTVGTFPE